jgi:hypothetical protein
VEAACPWFGSKLNGTLTSFAAVKLVDGGEDWGDAAEALGQPRLREIETIASANTARRARKDRSLVMFVVPLCPIGMLRGAT